MGGKLPSGQGPEQYRMTALRCLLVGDIKRHIDLREGEINTYQELRNCIMNYAVARKLEKERNGNAPMDIGQMSRWPYDQEQQASPSTTVAGPGKGVQDEYTAQEWYTWQKIELHEYRENVDPTYLDYKRDIIVSV